MAVAVGAHGGVGGEGDARVPTSPGEAEPFSQRSAVPCRDIPLPHFLGCSWHTSNNHSSQNTLRLLQQVKMIAPKPLRTVADFLAERTHTLAISPSILAGKHVFICIINRVC